MKPAVLYVPLHLLAEDPAYTMQLTGRVHVCAVLPRIVHDNDLPTLTSRMREVRAMGVREVLVGNLGLLIPARECGMHARGDFGLNIYNSGAMYAAREMELRSACLSFEMTLPQIRDLNKAVNTELIAYGRLPLMLTEHCLMKNRTGECSCQNASSKLTDKTGAEFPIIKDGNNCRSVLLNGKKLSWLDRQSDLGRLGLWAIRLYFTTENPKEVDRILADYMEPTPFDPGACTRGLYLRGVE
jgi:putative protease